jgi:serine/threonine protein kinase
MSDEIHYPTGFSLKDIVSWGNTGMVCLDESSQTVVKSPHGEEDEEAIAIERRIYERISEHGGHKGLLRYHGCYESGIRLEYVCNNTLRSFIGKPTKDINIENLRFRWARQITDTLRFLHSIHVIHGDLTCGNIFLDKHLNAKLGDFGGSSLDGSPLLVEVTASHKHPGLLLSIQGDIFALGSALYEIMTEVAPYHELSEEEIDARYSDADFPETESLGSIGDIIKYCWQGQYGSVDAIITDIEGMFISDDV